MSSRLVLLTDSDIEALNEARAAVWARSDGLWDKLCSIVDRYYTGAEEQAERQHAKELREVKRLNRRLVAMLSDRAFDRFVTYFPELRELRKKIRLALQRKGYIQNFRKQRLLREMRPSDLRALGLTPPSGEKTE